MPRQGGIYELTHDGARARQLLVVSDDDWNEWANDSLVVPLYPVADVSANLLRPVVSAQGVVADCTRVTSAPHEVIGGFVDECPAAELDAIRQALSAFLCVSDLRRGRLTGPAPTSRDWYPHQHRIYHGDPPGEPPGKMYAVLTEDEHWNAIQDWVVTARLTSIEKTARLLWESPVQGGCICAGNLFQLERRDIARTPPRAPRPQALAQHEKVALAKGLSLMLTLP